MRDTLARGCIALRLTPNALTVLGTLITAVGGLFFAMGAQSSHGISLAPGGSANAYLLLAALMLLLASACDVLDGAVARLAPHRRSRGRRVHAADGSERWRLTVPDKPISHRHERRYSLA